MQKSEADDDPSIYVDKELLAKTVTTCDTAAQTHSSEYRINNEIFCEELHSQNSLKRFEIFVDKVDEMENDYDLYCSTPVKFELLQHADDSKPLQVSLKSVPNGYIINGSCYLSWQQWHSIVSTTMSERILKCVLCDVYCSDKDCERHVLDPGHVQYLYAYPPLARFDLSITRKIVNQYHCAVCNETFGAIDLSSHFSSNLHEKNLLFAINRAFEILDDFGYTGDKIKQDTYHFKPEHKVVDNSYFNRDTCRSETHVKDFNDDTFNYHDNSYFKGNAFNNSRDNDFSSDNSDLKVDNSTFINYQSYEDVDPEPIPAGLTYASMARKPMAAAILDIDLGNKKLKVRHDSWHMVIRLENNRFWCMLCKIYEHISLKTAHCNEEQHLKNLNSCPIVEAYEEYFIRKIDDKLYHCGHCNNLQLIHQMADHVKSNHPRRTRLFSEKKEEIKNDIKSVKSQDIQSPVKANNLSPSSSIQNAQVLNSSKSTPDNKYSERSAVASNRDGQSVASVNSPLMLSINNGQPVTNVNAKKTQEQQTSSNDIAMRPTNTNINNLIGTVNKDKESTTLSFNLPGITDNMVIYPFGFKISVSCLSYNMVSKRDNTFYCELCQVVLNEHIIVNHVYNIQHVELLQRTPFIQPFSCNLIRVIRNILHCAICNITETLNNIHEHIRESRHIAALTTALSLGNKHELPVMVQIPNVPPPPLNTACEMSNNDNVANKGNTVTKNSIAVQSGSATKQLYNSDTDNDKYKTHTNSNQTTRVDQAVELHKQITAASDEDKAKDLKEKTTPPEEDKCADTNNKNKHNENANVENEESLETSFNETPNEEVESDELNSSYESATLNKEVESDELNNSYESAASEDATFDFEEHVYLKLKNSYIKVSNTSYNSLVAVGDGSRYCFVCSVRVVFRDLQKHVDNRRHLENIEKYRFVEKYGDNLLRQIYLMYHCALCNVIVARRQLKNHLDWPTHTSQYDNLVKNLKKTRKNDIKGGVKQIVVSTQKENIYLNEQEPKVKVHLYAKVVDKLPETKEQPETNRKDEKDEKPEEGDYKKHKIIILNDNVFKICWESWNGINEIKNGYRCILCQRDLASDEVDVHCGSEWHRYSFDKPFEKNALIRKVNDTILHCLICNREVSNKERMVTEHVNGKKHIKNYDDILNVSSTTKGYTDCQKDVLML